MSQIITKPPLWVLNTTPNGVALKKMFTCAGLDSKALLTLGIIFHNVQMAAAKLDFRKGQCYFWILTVPCSSFLEEVFSGFPKKPTADIMPLQRSSQAHLPVAQIPPCTFFGHSAEMVCPIFFWDVLRVSQSSINPCYFPGGVPFPKLGQCCFMSEIN